MLHASRTSKETDVRELPPSITNQINARHVITVILASTSSKHLIERYSYSDTSHKRTTISRTVLCNEEQKTVIRYSSNTGPHTDQKRNNLQTYDSRFRRCASNIIIQSPGCCRKMLRTSRRFTVFFRYTALSYFHNNNQS